MPETSKVSKSARDPNTWLSRDYAQDLLLTIVLPGEPANARQHPSSDQGEGE